MAQHGSPSPALVPNTSHLSQKREKQDKKAPHLAYYQKAQRKNKELSMYRLREMEIDDKVCEQVSMTMLSEVYPKDVIKRCVQQSEPWSSKVRRMRLMAAFVLRVVV